MQEHERIWIPPTTRLGLNKPNYRTLSKLLALCALITWLIWLVLK